MSNKIGVLESYLNLGKPLNYRLGNGKHGIRSQISADQLLAARGRDAGSLELCLDRAGFLLAKRLRMDTSPHLESLSANKEIWSCVRVWKKEPVRTV